MKKFALLSIIILSITTKSWAQVGDTVTIQTLEFTDITKRRGWYVLPPDTSSYSKILMYYTLKCDAQTTQDGYACGEWDYTTYTNIYKPQNIGDTIFFKGNNQPDTIFYSNTPGFNVYQSKQYQSVIDATATETEVSVSTGGTPTAGLFGSSKTNHSQFIYTLADLNAAGLTAGNIDRLKFVFANAGNGVDRLSVKMKNSTLTELTPNDFESNGLVEVFKSDIDVVAGANILNFTTPFLWDGTSNIVIDISHTGSSNITTQGMSVASGYNSGIITNYDNGYLNFSGDDYVEVPTNGLSSLSDEITISFWCYGDPNKQPRNNYTLEGKDANGNRVVNVHLPWSNSEVYWDCGNAGTSGYDRINALANLSDFSGEWNHWAFTKNASTGVMRIYLNGNLFVSGTGKTNTLSTIKTFKIGGKGGDNYDGEYEGKIDEFRIWNKELSAAEISAYMNIPIGVTHPQFSDLLVAYSFDEASGFDVLDYSPNANHGIIMGLPNRELWSGSENNFGHTQLLTLPELSLYQGTYTSHLDSTLVNDTVTHSMFTVVRKSSALDLNQSGISSTPIDTLYHYEIDPSITYDVNGDILTVVTPNIAGYYVNTVKLTTHQIQNYVTPYGIGLSLNGSAGFRYVYDVTDYEPVLHDTIEFLAGNQQELIDVKFLYIKGTPPRDVLKFETIALGDYQHADIANDVVMKAVATEMLGTASQFVVRTRTTGHWFGGYQNCAEFCPKNHNIKINGTQTHEWLNWKKCAKNPIKSQGGTWVYDRAGWCPGSFADTYDHDITPFVTAGAMNTVDYGMETTAAGMEGNYRTTVQLFQYGAPNFQTDARIEDVISPNNWEWHSNQNPMCDNPKVLIKNTGANDIQSVRIGYWVCGGDIEYYTWSGSLSFMDTTTVVLPIPDQEFWIEANYCQLFNVKIFEVNGQDDDYSENDYYQTSFDLPPSIPGDLILWYKSNLSPNENELYVYDDADNIIYSKTNAVASTQYKDTVNLTPGCYKVVLTDAGEDGLTFFANSAQGAGNLILRKAGGGTLKSFDSDFGAEIVYYFTSGYALSTDDRDVEASAKVYPNPNEGIFQLETDGFIGDVTLTIFNALGKHVKTVNRYADIIISSTQIDLTDLPTGYYMMQVNDEKNMTTIPVIKN